MDEYEYKRWEERKAPLESDEWKKSPSKKRRALTKEFCRGHEGREHQMILVKHSWANGRACQPTPEGEQSWRYGCHCYEKCAVCGKQFWGYRKVRYCDEYYKNARKMHEEKMNARLAKHHLKPTQ